MTPETTHGAASRSAAWDRKFWARVNRSDGCWEWQGYRDRQGYGHLSRKVDGPMLAHRFAWLQFNGSIPAGAVIRHICDNPPCCNPDHLLIGTQADNIADRQRRGRHRPGRFPGEAHPMHRLTELTVLDLRRRYADGESAVSLARECGISPDWMRRIASGRAWKHLNATEEAA